VIFEGLGGEGDILPHLFGDPHPSILVHSPKGTLPL
jgi:hypothetical protein